MIRHSPEHFRQFSGSSSNTEKGQVQFNELKAFPNLPSYHHPENVILIEQFVFRPGSFKWKGKYYHEKGLTFLKLYQPIKATLSDSLILLEWIEKYVTCCKVLLQKISNYLIYDIKYLQGTDDGVIFFDINQPRLDAVLHYFHSSSVRAAKKTLLIISCH